ncbi:MAG: DoxX family protein [Proteobacteria bacterium]|nr:DoxX family protein [Pseudomonadota bacterium]MDA1058653.1 DoxX family protein [Pseudomonadota bacterium]
MSDISSTAPSRRRTIIVWVLTALAVVAFAGAGLSKLSGSADMVTAFNAFGFPLWFMTLVGLAEVAGAVVLLLPPIAFIGGLGLMGVAGGAFITHMASGDSFGTAIPSIVLFVLITVVTWLSGRNFARTATNIFGQ